MTIAADLIRLLRTWHRMPAAELLDRLKVSRATMMRAIRDLGTEVVAGGKARRTAYAVRRTLRGSGAPIPLFRIDETGRGSQAGQLDLVYPHGCLLTLENGLEWPLSADMRDGWFDGIPYPLDDMRPQGFLGRSFARLNGSVLQVSDNPDTWSEDDTLYALSVLGSDQPGNYILGETAYRRFLQEAQQPTPPLAEHQITDAYLARAHEALTFGVGGSSAAGEFPKFTAQRMLDGEPAHVIVKFSGNDTSEATRRWADLLVCEHLAATIVASHLRIAASSSQIYQAGGRTFLEVRRFDRHGAFGRSPVCSWAALNAAIFGIAGQSWIAGANAMRNQGMISKEAERDIQRVWHFGQLIANTDMHDGNLAFRPGLLPAPVYDMLPMHYAPVRGVELPTRQFLPQLPLPKEAEVWQEAAHAAIAFWECAGRDQRISGTFRLICLKNATTLIELMNSAAPKSTEPRSTDS